MSELPKFLLFDGAGMDDPASDIGNHRIRTRLLNSKGVTLYLEIANGARCRFIMHCFNDHCNEDSRFRRLEGKNIQSDGDTKAGILRWVNSNLDCAFEEMVVDRQVSVHGTTEPLCCSPSVVTTPMPAEGDSQQSDIDIEADTLEQRVARYLSQLAPHMRSREGGVLLEETLNMLRRFRRLSEVYATAERLRKEQLQAAMDEVKAAHDRFDSWMQS